MSPSSKYEVSIFALDHINFGGSANPSGPQVSISTECLYFGKVTDFIDGILLDRPDSYNRVLVNCLYGHGMVQLVLTTLVAASQLLFTVDKAPAPPMETDDGNSKPDGKDEIDHS